MPSPKAPVLLLSFNRPDLSSRVFERIREYKPERLYLAVDGARDPATHPRDAEATARCRELALKVDWECEVFTRFSDVNQGCGRGVSNAITWMFEQESSGIILEDDCVPEATFFDYCAELLERYRDQAEVMHICGNSFADRRAAGACAPNSYAFTRYPDLWGWATWARAWKHFRYQLPPPEEILKSHFIMEGVDRYRQYAQRDRVLSTKDSMWGYRWHYTVMKNRGLCAAPAVNQISNTGFGDEATHTTGAGSLHAANVPTRPLAFPLSHPPSITVSPAYNRIYADNVLGSTGRYRKRYIKRWIRTLLIPGYVPRSKRRRLMRLFRRLLRRIDPMLATLAARSRLGSAFYYGFFRSDFAREQMSFAAGRIAYQESLDRPTGSMAILRRNVHRLEKGLLMQPRRVPFALDYIGETVDAYRTACGSGIDPAEFEWARDVLTEYFAVHEGELKSAPHAASFHAAATPPNDDGGPPRIPYRRDLAAPLPVDLEALRALAVRRRSVRWFLQKPVPREAIDHAIEIGTQAPSACNRQPFAFRIFDDREIVNKVIDIPFGLAGYGHNVPVVIVVVGQQRHFFSERDRHLIYIDASLAVMGLLYGLEVQGLSSCCVNWPDIPGNEVQMAKLLGLSADERPVMLIALGYPDPDGLVARSTKKGLATIRRYNFE